MSSEQEIIKKYFEQQAGCVKLSCHSVIFELDTKTEWFFENQKWCYFKWSCEDKDYRLIQLDRNVFSKDAEIKKMSYEIMMLLSLSRLRGIVTIDKEDLSRYIVKYEDSKKGESGLSLEQFNIDLRMREDVELTKSQKIIDKILVGCLGLFIVMAVLVAIVLISYFTAMPVGAKSRYSQEFIQSFAFCRKYTETKYNSAYNTNSTYEIRGYKSDGSGNCEYVETNEWLKGKNITTCLFSNKEIDEFSRAMMSPDMKHSVEVKGMAVVGGREEVTFLKYFNNPKICTTVAVPK